MSTSNCVIERKRSSAIGSQRSLTASGDATEHPPRPLSLNACAACTNGLFGLMSYRSLSNNRSRNYTRVRPHSPSPMISLRPTEPVTCWIDSCTAWIITCSVPNTSMGVCPLLNTPSEPGLSSRTSPLQIPIPFVDMVDGKVPQSD